MNDDGRRQSVKAYFDGIAAKDMSRVPWKKDATLRTPLNPAGGEERTDLRPRSNPRIFQQHSSCRQQHLRKNRVPWDLEKFWIGHANKHVTDKYAAQL